MTPWLLLLFGLVSAALAYNVHRPGAARGYTLIPRFLLGWWASELAAHGLAVQIAVTATLVVYGALAAPAGWVGLALMLASWWGLYTAFQLGRSSRAVIRAVLDRGLGSDPAGDADEREHVHAPLPLFPLIMPLWLWDRAVERIGDLPYGDDHRRQRLDIYRARAGVTRAPVVLQIHGGAWIIGNKRQQGMPLVLHLAARGFVCVSINYRLSPRATFPDHIVDVKRAIAWIREHIAEYGGDPDFIVITGGSAGGHLAALAALSADDPEFQPGFEDIDTAVRACVPFYGVFDFTHGIGPSDRMSLRRLLERRVMKRSRDDDPDLFRRASPIHRALEQAPPFLVIH
ncbi:MAG: alpha/beta hydrolase, partial [Myxococcales bacterium]|nr:alpha/beta hydrolase [Myxococcales bacterium]